MQRTSGDWPTRWHSWAWGFANAWLVVAGIGFFLRRLSSSPWSIADFVVLAATAVPISLIVWLGNIRKRPPAPDPAAARVSRREALGEEQRGGSSMSAREVLLSAWPHWWQTLLWWSGIIAVSGSLTVILARLIVLRAGFDAWSTAIAVFAGTCVLLLFWAGQRRLRASGLDR